MDFGNKRRNLLVPTFWSAMGISETFKSADTGFLLNCNLLTFTTNLIILNYTYLIRNYRTIDIIGSPTSPDCSFMNESILYEYCEVKKHISLCYVGFWQHCVLWSLSFLMLLVAVWYTYKTFRRNVMPVSLGYLL
jgi:hypothetical protein